MRTAIAAIALSILVAGCGLIPQKYDNNEYELLARLETNASIINERCDDTAFVESRLPDLEFDARLLNSYTLYIPRNTDVYQISNILRDDVNEFKAQYEKGEATPSYCKIKTKLFLKKVRDTLEAVAQKPRG